MKETLWLFLKGLCMGAADIVPGVSGGTIAFITGIYDQLIRALKKLGDSIKEFGKLLTGKSKWKKVWKPIEFKFFIPLALGILLAFGIGSLFIPKLIEHYPAQVFAFFIGLILASAWIVYKHIKKHSLVGIVAIIIGVLFGYWLSTIPPLGGVGTPNPLWITLLGGIAICAMLLPGISGSYLMLIFGRYEFMLEQIRDLNFLYIGAFGVGAIIGLLLFSRLLAWLLKKYHNITFSALTGIMLGALAKPGTEVLNNWGMPAVTVAVFLIGMVLVLIIDKAT